MIDHAGMWCCDNPKSGWQFTAISEETCEDMPLRIHCDMALEHLMVRGDER